MGSDSLIFNEIRGIPKTIEVIKSRVKDLEKVALDAISREIGEIVFTGCGSSYYAAIKSTYPLTLSHIKVHAYPVSELLWIISKRVARNTHENTLIAVFSRSGETAEVKALLNATRGRKDVTTIGITCNPDSYLANNADYTIAIKECLEESVYMTKSFVALSITGTLLSTLMLESTKPVGLSGIDLNKELEVLSGKSRALVSDLDGTAKIANTILRKSPIVVLGTEDLYPIAMEAALKFIEVSYTYSIALHALEFRHGYTGLLENPELSVIVLSNIESPSYEYVKNLYHELKSAGINTIHISNSSDTSYVVNISGKSYLETILYIIPLYYIAIFRAIGLGYDPDKPRHIVKVVTKI